MCVTTVCHSQASAKPLPQVLSVAAAHAGNSNIIFVNMSAFTAESDSAASMLNIMKALRQSRKQAAIGAVSAIWTPASLYFAWRLSPLRPHALLMKSVQPYVQIATERAH